MTVLFKRHFQIAYVVDDAKSAIDALSKRYGVEKWDIMDMKAVRGADAPTLFGCTAWVADTMIEVIEPDKTISSIYSDWKSESDSPLRFHHLGFLVDSPDEFAETKEQLVRLGFPIVMDGSFGEVLDFAYADTTAELGHYYEVIRMGAEGDSYFGRIPVN